MSQLGLFEDGPRSVFDFPVGCCVAFRITEAGLPWIGRVVAHTVGGLLVQVLFNASGVQKGLKLRRVALVLVSRRLSDRPFAGGGNA